MGVDYSPRMFFRQFAGPLLREYFLERGNEDVPELKPEKKAKWNEILFEYWDKLDRKDREETETDFRKVFGMAEHDKTISAILTEAEYHKKTNEFLEAFKKQGSVEENILWTITHYPGIFGVADLFDTADNLNKKYWRVWPKLPACQPKDTPDDCAKLARALSAYFQAAQSRGRACHVEAYKRHDEIYFFAFLEDYPYKGGTFDQNQKFNRQVIKNSFEVIFRINPSTGILESFVKGRKDVAVAVNKIFAEICLGIDLPEFQKGKKGFNLDPLKSRNFNFHYTPEHGIKSIKLKALKFVIEGSSRRITLDTGADNPKDIYDMLDNITAGGLSPKLLKACWANIKVVIDRTPQRNKTIDCKLSENSCNLGDTNEEKIVREYLAIWGLKNDESEANTFKPSVAG